MKVNLKVNNRVSLGSATLLIFVNGAIAFISEAIWITADTQQLFVKLAYLMYAVLSFSHFSEISSN